MTADPVALRRLALRRALAAAYPLTGGAAASTEEDDAAAVRRAAGAALAYVDAAGAAPPHSMSMPLMGHAVIAVGGEWGSRRGAWLERREGGLQFSVLKAEMRASGRPGNETE